MSKFINLDNLQTYNNKAKETFATKSELSSSITSNNTALKSELDNRYERLPNRNTNLIKLIPMKRFNWFGDYMLTITPNLVSISSDADGYSGTPLTISDSYLTAGQYNLLLTYETNDNTYLDFAIGFYDKTNSLITSVPLSLNGLDPTNVAVSLTKDCTHVTLEPETYNSFDSTHITFNIVLTYSDITPTAYLPYKNNHSIKWGDLYSSGPITSTEHSGPAIVIDSYYSDSVWYRIWSDGWKECGGTVTSSSSGWRYVSMPCEFSNSNYSLLCNLNYEDSGDKAYAQAVKQSGINYQFRVCAQINSASTYYAYPIIWEAKGY